MNFIYLTIQTTKYRTNCILYWFKTERYISLSNTEWFHNLRNGWHLYLLSDSSANNTSYPYTPHEDESVSKALHPNANGSVPHVGTLCLLHRVAVDVDDLVKVPCHHL